MLYINIYNPNLINIHYEKGLLIQMEYWSFFSLISNDTVENVYNEILKERDHFRNVKIVSELPDIIELREGKTITRQDFSLYYKLYGSVENILKNC